MRQGFNPYKDQTLEQSDYVFHVVIPVFIPNQDGYFKESFSVLKLCLQSLFQTCSYPTKITIVDNGSCSEVSKYLQNLASENQIQDLLQTENIGKLNAILKGISGNKIPLVTISDSDVLFLSNWQQETVKVFNAFHKAAVVGLTPQFKMYESCPNVIFDTFFSKKLQFRKPINPDAMYKFYDSIGWEYNYNQDYLKFILRIEANNASACIGSGHFVATYNSAVFETLPSYFNAKMGANSESFLDEIAAFHNAWKLTTSDNFAYHIGNTPEDWMQKITFSKTENNIKLVANQELKRIKNWKFALKNKVFKKIFKLNFFRRYFYKIKGLPKHVAQNY